MSGQLTVGSLFSGIGGLDLGLERAGMRVVWQCEIDKFCQSVLRRWWPGVRLYDDIHDIDESAERVDLICGGFPCQPVSLAGKGLAQKDPRWLWPEFARVVGLLRPRFVVVENVPGLVKRGLGDVVGDLAAMGYDAEWQIVSAASQGAPHLRERIILVAYAECGELRLEPGRSSGTSGEGEALAGVNGSSQPVAGSDSEHAHGNRLRWEGGRSEDSDRRRWIAEPEVGRVAHGVPGRVAQLRALGNAVVPQVAEFVGRLIVDAA